MQSKHFDQAFDSFLEREEYEQAIHALYGMVLISYVAGWQAAGGDAPRSKLAMQLLLQEKVINLIDLKNHDREVAADTDNKEGNDEP